MNTRCSTRCRRSKPGSGCWRWWHGRPWLGQKGLPETVSHDSLIVSLDTHPDHGSEQSVGTPISGPDKTGLILKNNGIPKKLSTKSTNNFVEQSPVSQTLKKSKLTLKKIMSLKIDQSSNCSIQFDPLLLLLFAFFFATLITWRNFFAAVAKVVNLIMQKTLRMFSVATTIAKNSRDNFFPCTRLSPTVHKKN